MWMTPGCYALALSGCLAGSRAPFVLPPLAPNAVTQARLEHANASGTLAAAGRPTGRHFVNGFGAGVVLGPVGLALAATSADPDPLFVPITPPPVYADTSAVYIAAFRQGYDQQVRRNRRDAAAGGGLVGMLVGGAVWYAILSNGR